MVTAPSLRTSTQLSLTPQLRQAIRLLQMSTLELHDEINQILEENPFLEREDDAFETSAGAEPSQTQDTESSNPREDETSADDHPTDELDWDVGPGATGASGTSAGNSPDDAMAQQNATTTLADHLHQQALGLRLSPEDAATLYFLIESLDEDGYLRDSLGQLAATLTDDNDDLDTLQTLVHRFQMALKLLQSMEPTGVGARNLTECLNLQLGVLQAQSPIPAHAEPKTIDTALQLLALPQALELLARHDHTQLAHASATQPAQVRAAAALIAQLEPKPGRPFGTPDNRVISIDVVVHMDEQKRLHVALNPEVMPRLRVHEVYARALRTAGGQGDGSSTLGEHLQQARWLVRSIQQRFDTILRVSQAIVQHQRAFFMHGDLAMRPMLQRELAERLEVHESTISRATNGKYMATPRGTFELKHFFGSALTTRTGGQASSTAVRALIGQFIAAENPLDPLSDQQITDLLQKQGVDCARRTVAKYRQTLKLPTASRRKKSVGRP